MILGGLGTIGAESAAADVKIIIDENNALKKVIEQMKVDMETIVERVKEEGDNN